MSAVVCGSKRSYFEDLPAATSPPVSSKRLRCSSTSPIRFTTPSLLDQLRSVFPHMGSQVLERALEECGNDIDAAIRRLQELSLRFVEENSSLGEELEANVESCTLNVNGDAAISENLSAPDNLPLNGAEWVELFVREMMSATTVDDARARASKVLEVLEKSISTRAGAKAAETIHKENQILKEQIEVLIRENSILKRAVAIQHERQKEYEERSREVEHLKQLVSQYHEQMRTLEVKNYALSMHLKQAQQCSSFPGHFNPDVF